jgi:hypothetical protein
MEVLAERVRTAMESADLVAMEALLAPDARWGAPEQRVPTCRNAKQILSWYEMARETGVRADVTEVTIVGERIVVGLKILPSPTEQSNPGDAVRWQVLSTEDGLVAEIRGYETRDEATTFATSGVSRWKK